MANKERIVDLVVRAKDQYSKVLANLKKQQQEIAEAGRKAQLQFLTSTRKELAATQAQIKAMSQQRDNYKPAAGASRSQVAQDVLLQVEAQKKLIAKAQQLKAGLAGVEAATHRVKVGQASSFSEFIRNTTGLQGQATAANTAATALKKVEAASNGVAAAQARMTSAASKTRARGNSGGRKGESQDVEMYGLKPYQMVNLGYQVNDVIGGLAMGQAPIQIIAQQAGQFAQIWPNMMVGLIRSIPQIAAVTAILSPFITAIVRLRTESKSLQYFTSQLALLADGGRYTAQELAGTAREIAKLGVSIEDARKMTLGFAKSGMSNSEMLPLAKMAKDLTNLTGGDLADAGARLSKVFSGSVKDVRELDQELQFLTAAQLEQLYAMERSGDKAGALKLAQDALKTSLSNSRAESTDWSEAVDSLATSWDKLIAAVEKSGIIWLAAKGLDLLAMSAKGTALMIEDVASVLAPDDVQKYFLLYDKMNRLRSEIEADRSAIDAATTMGNTTGALALTNHIKALEAELAEVEVQFEAINKTLNKLPDASEKTTEQSEEQKKLALDTSEILRQQVNTMVEEAATAALTNRERFIEAELLKARNAALERAKELGLDFNGLTEEQNRLLREQAGMTFDKNAGIELVNSGMSGLVDKIIGVESGGNASAKNPNSSATGLGQFISSTWLAMFRKHFPAEAAKMGEAAILELRKDSEISRQMVELYARENAKILQGAGIAVNDAALYLAHFLGPQGAAGILSAKASTPVSDILGVDQINANASILQGKNASEVIAWAQKKMGLTESEMAVTTRLAEIDAERLKTSKEYQDEYRQRIETQQFELSLASKAAREATIAKAIQEEEVAAKKAGLELTKAQREEITRTTGALFDRENVELRVNELMEQRSLLMETLDLAQSAGDSGKVANIVDQIQGTEEALNAAIADAIAFWQAIGGPGADAAIMKLENIRGAVGDVVSEIEGRFLPTAEAINEQLADVGSNAFSAMAEAIANGTNVAQAFFDTLLQGIGDFLIEMGKAIVKQALFNAISGGSSGGGTGGFLSGLIGKLFHSGGVVGRSGGSGSRMVNPAVFAGAQRFHGGGVLGLGPNEVPIIGLKDEEMLTRDDPRHVMNGGGSGGSTNIKNVNVFDPVDVLEAALASEVGEKVFMNWMTRRARTINGALSV